MSQIPFLGPTYAGRSVNFDSSRCVNFFIETGSEMSKAPAMLVGTPGTASFASTSYGSIRGMHGFNGGIYFVVANQLRYVSSTGVVSASLGAVPTLTGRVDMADNGVQALGVGGNQLIIVDGTNGYIFNISTSTFTQITDPSFPANPTKVTYIDGYFIVTNDTMTYHCSKLYDGLTWPALAFASVIASPDAIQTPINLHQQLILIKSTTTELWYDAGTDTSIGSPFVRQQGAVYDFGTPAKWSVSRGDNSIFFLATQRTSNGYSFVGVAELSGYQPQIISTPSVTYFISQSTTLDNCFGYCYAEEGSTFYVVTNPDDNWTLVYNATTKLWHEWSTYSGNPYQVNRHFGNAYASINGKHYIGSYIDPTIYHLSNNYYTDDGLPIVSFRTAPHLNDKNVLENIFITKLIIDAETGVGDTSYTVENDPTAYYGDGTWFGDGTINGGGIINTTTYGSDPHATLSWSNDYGHTWSSEYPASLGRIGEYKRRLIWRRVGYGKDKVFRLTVGAPVKKILMGAYVEGSA